VGLKGSVSTLLLCIMFSKSVLACVSVYLCVCVCVWFWGTWEGELMLLSVQEAPD